jgi:hypothetical protein
MATPTALPATFTSGQVLTASQMNNLRGAFRVLQVVQTVKTDTFTTSSTTPVDVTGLSATITPSSTSSKILILTDVAYSIALNNYIVGFIRLAGGNAGNYIGDASSNRTRTTKQLTFSTSGDIQASMFNFGATYLDSPNTTSATTYKVQVWLTSNSASPLVTVNRRGSGFDDAAYSGVGASSITVMEISA